MVMAKGRICFGQLQLLAILCLGLASTQGRASNRPIIDVIYIYIYKINICYINIYAICVPGIPWVLLKDRRGGHASNKSPLMCICVYILYIYISLSCSTYWALLNNKQTNSYIWGIYIYTYNIDLYTVGPLEQ